jgi:hypothetical protein
MNIYCNNRPSIISQLCSVLPAVGLSIYLSIYVSIYLLLYSPSVGPWPFFSFTLSVGLLGRGDQAVARPLPAHRTAQTQNKRTQTSMPQVGFESTISIFERAKTVHALDSAAAVIGVVGLYAKLIY